MSTNTTPPGFDPTEADPTPEQLDHVRRQAARERERQPSSGERLDFFDIPKPERVGDETETVVRLLPSWEKSNTGPWFFTWWEHFGKYKDGDRYFKGGMPCIGSFTGNKCPGDSQKIAWFVAANEAGEPREKAPRDQMPNRVKGRILRPYRRGMWNVIDAANTARHRRADGSLHPAVLQTNSSTVIKKILALAEDDPLLAHWKHGKTLRLFCKRISTYENGVRYRAEAGRPHELKVQWWPILDNLVKLDELIRFPSHDEEARFLSLAYPSAYRMDG